MNAPQIQNAFSQCAAGYHMLNNKPISEGIWEDINGQIFTDCNIEIYSTADGSHAPGMDIDSSIGKFSNKSAKYAKKTKKTELKRTFDISSHRLTKECSSGNCGDITQIVEKINSLKNFDHYSIIVRDDSKPLEMKYDWYMIPSNHASVNPSSYEWIPTIGKQGKNKDKQVGWHTNEYMGCSMSISFSMSSQLWIHIEVNPEMENFIVASCVTNRKPTLNYIQLNNMFSLQSPIASLESSSSSSV